MAETLRRLFGQGPSRDTYLIIGSSVATTLAVVTIARLALAPTPPKKIIRSPRETLLPKISKQGQGDLPYPPDVFPGARDVESPYGTCRVYEWGPETGRKILFIHGISTPCISLGGVANALVSKGCRVMLLDLWGRGYSDSPNLPHDSRLYTTQILLAITSSKLPWSLGFSIIGYSLGGGIAADFGAYFPDMLESVVLLAPSGLIRDYHFGWQSKLLYTGILSESVIERIVRKRLTSGPSNQSTVQKLSKKGAKSNAENAVVAEAKADGNKHYSSRDTPLSKERPNITVASAVQWQIAHNEGFVRSFISSIKYASITKSEGTWAKLRNLRSKVVIIAGSTDEVIVAEELHEDAKAAVGEDKMEWRLIEGGHEFPITSPYLVAKEIGDIWGI
ncbi:Alpha/Beta hydrolase protein [Halenospora varia]|nr:Alpha/Beta hydrolase protein [Halenospora varia]